MTDRTGVELQAAAVRVFLTAVADGAVDVLDKKWDGGALIPLVQVNGAGFFDKHTVQLIKVIYDLNCEDTHPFYLPLP